MAKSVRLPDEQERYVEKTNLNFSEWTREQLAQKMEREHYGECVICDCPVYVTTGHEVGHGTPLASSAGLSSDDEDKNGRVPMCDAHYNQALGLVEQPEAADYPTDFVPDGWTRVTEAEMASLAPDSTPTPRVQYTGRTVDDESLTVSLEYDPEGEVWCVLSRLADDPNRTYVNSSAQKNQAIGHSLLVMRTGGRRLPDLVPSSTGD